MHMRRTRPRGGTFTNNTYSSAPSLCVAKTLFPPPIFSQSTQTTEPLTCKLAAIHWSESQVQTLYIHRCSADGSGGGSWWRTAAAGGSSGKRVSSSASTTSTARGGLGHARDFYWHVPFGEGCDHRCGALGGSAAELRICARRPVRPFQLSQSACGHRGACWTEKSQARCCSPQRSGLRTRGHGRIVEDIGEVTWFPRNRRETGSSDCNQYTLFRSGFLT